MLTRINRPSVIVAQILLMAAVLSVWELRARHDPTFQFFFSRPGKIAMRLADWLTDGQIYMHTLHTMTETLLGFALGVTLGFGLALICYYVPFLHQVIRPFMQVANAMPRAVFGPLFILWFGLGMTSKVVLAASLVLFIVFYNTLSGLSEVEQNILYKVRLFGASPLAVLKHVLFPSALTWVFSSLRTSAGFALAGAVVGEYVGASRGLGFQIALAEGNLDATGICTGLLMLSAIVLAMNAVLGRVERALTPWQTSQ